MNRLWALVPLNNLARATARLGTALAADDRRALVLAMAEDALSALAGVRRIERIVLVSSEPEAGRLLHNAPIDVFYSAVHEGLNEELEQAAAYAKARGATGALIVHADLPWLNSRALERFIAACPAESIGAARCKLGTGTNALLTPLPLPLPLVFGPYSLRKFSGEAAAKGLNLRVVDERRLSMDIDSLQDLQYLLARPAGGLAAAATTGTMLQRIKGLAPQARSDERIARGT